MNTPKVMIMDEKGVILWKISEAVSRDFPDIDPHDVFSSLYERLWTLEGASLKVTDPGVRNWLREEAEFIAWTIRVEQLKLTPQYSYRVPDVSKIMETVFDRTDWPSGFTPTDARNEFDRLAPLEVRMDASEAFRRLDSDLREILILRYYDRQVPEAGTHEAGRLRHSLNILTGLMNEYRSSRGH